MSAQLPGQQVRKAALLLRGLGLFGVSRSFPFLSLPSSPALVPHTRRKHGCQGLYVLHRHSRRTSFPLMIRAHMLSSLPCASTGLLVDVGGARVWGGCLLQFLLQHSSLLPSRNHHISTTCSDPTHAPHHTSLSLSLSLSVACCFLSLDRCSSFDCQSSLTSCAFCHVASPHFGPYASLHVDPP
jgi:hypothetical protein